MNEFKLKYDHMTGLTKHQSKRNRGFGGLLGPFGWTYLSQFLSDFKSINVFRKWALLSTIQHQIFLFPMKLKICRYLGPKLGPPYLSEKRRQGVQTKTNWKVSKSSFRICQKTTISFSPEKNWSPHLSFLAYTIWFLVLASWSLSLSLQPGP